MLRVRLLQVLLLAALVAALVVALQVGSFAIDRVQNAGKPEFLLLLLLQVCLSVQKD